MASMSTEIAVLRALLLLARTRRGLPATVEDIVTRVRDDAAAVERALEGLVRTELVQRAGATLRLSLAGLAVAVAAAAQAKADARRAKTLTSGRDRVIPMVRRRRAA
jgi:DNA-binding IclR family transcriptional regulator